MPYIPQAAREPLESGTVSPRTPGELNYVFTRIALQYLEDHPNYQGINDVLGALEGAKLELYRKRVAPYEDEKAAINGDVFPSRTCDGR